MTTVRGCFRAGIRRSSQIVLALAVLAALPFPLAADLVSASGFISYSPSAGGSLLVAFHVSPDGSVIYDNYQPQLDGPWEVDWNLCGTNFRFSCSPADIPALPDGSVINSAAFSFSASPILNLYHSDVPADVQTVTAVDGVRLWETDCYQGSWGFLPPWFEPQPIVGPLSFTPCSTSEQQYWAEFSGEQTVALQWDASSAYPGREYLVEATVGETVDFTVTVDYTVTPEPTTYVWLIGLGLIGLVVARTRKRAVQ